MGNGAEDAAIARTLCRIVIHTHISGGILQSHHHGKNSSRVTGHVTALALRRIPLVEEHLTIPEAICSKPFLCITRIIYCTFDIRIAVPGKEIHHRAMLPGICQEFLKELQKIFSSRRGICFLDKDVIQRIKAAGGISADLQMGEFRLQIFGGNVVQLKELLLGSLPAGIVLDLGLVIGLVPDLPVVQLHVIAVCPSLVIVQDDMLADPRPLCGILGRIDVVRLDRVIVLDGGTQTVKGLDPLLGHSRKEGVGKGEIIGRGIVLVRIEVAEYVGNIDIASTAVGSSRIVQTGIGHRCLCQAIQSPVKVVRGALYVVDGVHTLDASERRFKINGNAIHGICSFFF